MIKKYMKTSIAFLLVTMLIFSIFSNIVFATDSYSTQMNTLIGNLDAEHDGGDANTEVQNIVAIVINSARIIGVAVAIVMLLVVAMKYMSAAPGEKADIKKSAVVYVVGAVVLFAVTGILGIINSFSSNIKVN